MLESAVIYLGLTISMIILSYGYLFYYKKTGDLLYVRFAFWIAIILIFSSVFGARWDIEKDHISYLNIYESLSNNSIQRDDLEPGFVLLGQFLSKNGFHFFFFFALLAFFQIFFILLALKDRPKVLPFILFALMCGPFLSWMNIIRQQIVTCIFIWLIFTIENKNFFKYSLWILISAFFFHKSAIILLPLYPFIKNRLSYVGKTKLQLILFFIFFYLGFTHFILSKLNGLGTLVSLIGYGERYGNIEDFSVYFKDSFNWGFRSWIRVFLIFATILINKQALAFCKDKALITIYNFFFWGSCFSILTIGIENINRIFIYFSDTAFIVYGYFLYFVWEKRSYKKTNYCRMLAYYSLNILVLIGTLISTSLPDSHSKFQFFWQA